MRYSYKNKWQELLAEEFTQPYFKKLSKFVTKERAIATVYPPEEAVFTALEWTDFDDVKVVILGQDPYHGPNQAHGLSFSVLPGNKIPPSLRNIYKELASDLGIPPVNHGYLKHWADQGVLLLNTVLTVRQSEANSHKDQGWEVLTDQIICKLSRREKPVIFILWGKPAQRKSILIDQSRHFIINGPHPSPLSAYRGFFGSHPFSQINAILVKQDEAEIDWQLPITV